MKYSLYGQVFGRLTVTCRQPDMRWLCVCECGRTCSVMTAKLINGDVKSCGCYRQDLFRDANVTHGQTGTDEYNIWKGIKSRCSNVNDTAYHRYGERGIQICERWSHSFENFLSDMGPRPSPQHSVERKINSLGYEPGNCVWATDIEQSNNRRTNVVLTHRGVSKTVMEWSREYNISYRTLLSRLSYGWSVERTLTEPVRPSLEPYTTSNPKNQDNPS